MDKNQVLHRDSALDALKSIYERRVGIMQGYQTDFLCDAYALGKPNHKVSFLHAVERLGTYMEILYAADWYPKAGETVPYLFSQADREKILEGKGSTITYAATKGDDAQLYYYNGAEGTLRIVDFDQAEKIVAEYKESIRQSWQEERKEHA